MNAGPTLTQDVLTAENLSQGVDFGSAEEKPWICSLWVSWEPADFEQHRGIHFSASFDDLDDLDVAVLRTSAGAHAALVRHRGSPEPGIEIYVPEKDYPTTEQEIVAALGLPASDITWTRQLAPITFTEKDLAQGILHYTDAEIPRTPVALIMYEPSAQFRAIPFVRSFDPDGTLQFAVFQTHAGARFALRQYTDRRGHGVEVCVAHHDLPLSATIMAIVQDTWHIDPRKITLIAATPP